MVNWRNGARVGYNAGHSAKKIYLVMSTLMLTTHSHCTFTLYIHIFFMIVLINHRLCSPPLDTLLTTCIEPVDHRHIRCTHKISDHMTMWSNGCVSIWLGDQMAVFIWVFDQMTIRQYACVHMPMRPYGPRNFVRPNRFRINLLS